MYFIMQTIDSSTSSTHYKERKSILFYHASIGSKPVSDATKKVLRMKTRGYVRFSNVELLNKRLIIKLGDNDALLIVWNVLN